MLPDMTVKVTLLRKTLVTIRALMGAVASMSSKHRNKQTSTGDCVIPDMQVKARLSSK